MLRAGRGGAVKSVERGEINAYARYKPGIVWARDSLDRATSALSRNSMFPDNTELCDQENVAQLDRSSQVHTAVRASARFSISYPRR